VRVSSARGACGRAESLPPPGAEPTVVRESREQGCQFLSPNPPVPADAANAPSFALAVRIAGMTNSAFAPLLPRDLSNAINSIRGKARAALASVTPNSPRKTGPRRTRSVPPASENGLSVRRYRRPPSASVTIRRRPSEKSGRLLAPHKTG
jgi:hypothetical protein